MRICAAILLLFAWRAGAASPVFALVGEFDRIAAQPLWPGFDARKTPLELYDGANTYLFRHPAPPPEFAPVEGHPGFMMFPGRHRTMRANTAAEVGGVMTATLEGADITLAPVLVHECFHVFQAREHPSWTANEATLFTYPIDDAGALALARLELEAMSRALAAPQPACWAARVQKLRQERFARLPADAVAYERGNELHEGLAQYVEGMAAGRKEVRFRQFAAGEVRARGYVAGEALARLLDRLDPGWKSKVANSLDDLLPAADATACDFTQAERQAAEAQARVDVGKLERERSELMQAFDSQPGWRVTVEAASGKPLLLGGFDPMNVTRLSEHLILHKRMLKLHNDSGSLEILNHGSITEAAGAHPLFDGARRWTTAGLPAKPEVRQDGARVTVTTPVLNLAFSSAQVEWQVESLTIRLY
ncbi:MAG: hypothetical protein WB579_19115 [Bryobacteraceae bacterium]